MKANIGSIDRALRIAVGIALLGLIFVLEGQARWWGLVGLVPLVTGIVRFCPLYTLCGVSSCPRERRTA